MSSTQIDALLLEVEFVPGSWIDVSGWVDWSAGASLNVGRNTQFNQPSPSTFSCTLDNTDGRFSPLQQNLRDVDNTGVVTPNPYWPNVQPRRRLRYSWVIAGTPYPQFVGYVRGWPPAYKNLRGPRVTINAVDRLARLDQVTMSGGLTQAAGGSRPAYYWPLTDDPSAGGAAEYVNGPPLNIVGNLSAPITFGANGVGSGNGTAVQFSPVVDGTATDTQLLFTQALKAVVTEYTLEAWVNPGVALPAWGTYGVDVLELSPRAGNSYPDIWVTLDSTGALAASITGIDYSHTPYLVGPRILDGNYHHVVVSVSTSGTATLYVDGVNCGTGSTGSAGGPLQYLLLGQNVGNYITGHNGNGLKGLISQVAVYPRALTAAEVSDHFAAGHDYPGETVDSRVRRFLGYAGLAATDYLLDPSGVALSSYGQDGQSVLRGSQDMLVSEGGGALIYVRYDGKVRMLNRDARLSPTPDLTLSAAGDLAGEVYAPAFDDDNLINQVIASRATASNGSASTQTVSALDSIAAHDLTNEQITSYAQADSDVLYNAQQRVAAQAYPTFRMQQIAVDLYSAQTAGVGVAVATLELSSRLRVTGLDPSAAPTSTLDLMAEGWTDAIGDSSYVRTFDTTAADNPPPAFADDPVYGLAAAEGISLQTAVSATDATVVVVAASAVEPLFSTSAGDYPLMVLIGQEQLALPSPPTTSGLQQTFTGVARGVNGTPPAAQAAGSDVELSPAAGAAL